MISFKPSLTLFSWYIHQFAVCFSNLNPLAQSIIFKVTLIIHCMIIFNSFTCNENFSSVCSNHTEISARFTVMKFLPVIVILLLSSLSMRDVFSSSPVDIRRRFNVYKSSTSYRRLIDIETTSCVYWVMV